MQKKLFSCHSPTQQIKPPKKERPGSSQITLLLIPLVFGLPLFYNQQLPDMVSGMIAVQKHQQHQITMLSHRTRWA